MFCRQKVQGKINSVFIIFLLTFSVFMQNSFITHADTISFIEQGYLTSADAYGTKIFFKKNLVNNSKAAIVVVHGLSEHLGRYDYLTSKLNQAGYSIYRLDHRGHGKSVAPYVNNKIKKGNIDDFQSLIEDIHQLVKIAHQENPNKKIFMLGHSMGAIATEVYGIKHPNNVAGIVSNGGGIPLNVYDKPTQAPQVITAKKRNEKTLSEMVISDIIPLHKLTSFADNSTLSTVFKKLLTVATAEEIPPLDILQNLYFPNTLSMGIASDPKVREDYKNDKLNGKEMSVNTIIQIANGLVYASKNAEKFIQPTLIMHGKHDGLIPYFMSVNWFNALKVKDKKLILWNGMMHEVFNEPGKNQAIQLVINWFNAHI